MGPLIVLVIAFILSLAGTWLTGGHPDEVLSGNVAMCVMLCFTAMGHVFYRKGMKMMIPAFIPFKDVFVVATGIFELAAAVGLLFSGYRVIVSWCLIIFLLLILPANINAAFKRIDYQKGTSDGKGLSYLFFRIPLQVFYITWIGYFGIISA
jgi:uncharacterized membrane protein